MMEAMLWRYKYPFDYELSPSEIDVGTNWVTLKLKNIGIETLRGLDIRPTGLPRQVFCVFSIPTSFDSDVYIG